MYYVFPSGTPWIAAYDNKGILRDLIPTESFHGHRITASDDCILYQISEDILQVIFDNLILNSVQQNENTQKLMITIFINEANGFLNIKYCDNGKGLDDKYKTDPMKILEVHETTRTNGHGLGMWIVNNTCTMSGGEIQKICGEKGFEIEFTIGGKI